MDKKPYRRDPSNHHAFGTFGTSAACQKQVVVGDRGSRNMHYRFQILITAGEHGYALLSEGVGKVREVIDLLAPLQDHGGQHRRRPWTIPSAR